MSTTNTVAEESGPTTDAPGVPGEDAEKPQQIPARGWLQIAKRGWAEAKVDQVPLLAAGVAFYAFLALFPAMIAGVILYGVIADPATIADQVGSVTQTLPEDARNLITTQLTTLSGQNKAGFGAVLAVLLALWSASGGVGNLMTAINTAYDEEETRGFIKKRGMALLLTLGAIIFMVVMLGLVAVAPAVLNLFGGSTVVRLALQAVRYLVLVVVIAAALAILYRVAPDRDAPKMRWVSVGAGVATLLWLVASIGFSVYAGMGGYGKTYGALAGIVVLLFWLWITAYAILLGAEINAEAEQQTVADTTKGPSMPLGQRNAVKADTMPSGADPQAARSRPAADSADTASPVTTQTLEGEHQMTDDHPTTAATSAGSTPIKATPPGRDASIGDLVSNVSADLSRLVRDEMKLAQTEVTEKAKKAGIGVGALGGAGVAALFGLAILLTAAVLGLSTVLPAWLAALIVGVIVVAVAGVSFLIGRKKLGEAAPPTPTRAVASVKEDVNEIKETIKR